MATCSFAVEIPGVVQIDDNKDTLFVKNKSNKDVSLVDSFCI